MDRKEIIASISAAVVAAGLAVSSLFTIGKNSCALGLTSPHAHKYVNNNYQVVSYFTSEKEDNHGFQITDDYIDITGFEKRVLDICTEKGLFYSLYYPEYADKRISDCENLRNVCDYLQYYYYKEWYTEEKVVDSVTYDEDGRRHETYHYERVRHVDEGWTTNQHHSDLTGKVKYNHVKFYACRFVNRNGKMEIEYSDSVDDLREVLNDYPYVATNFYTYDSKTYKFSSSFARHCKISDFDDFYIPSVSDYIYEDGFFNNTRELTGYILK